MNFFLSCIDILEQNFEYLLDINSEDVFVLTGDLNHMDTSRFESILGFVIDRLTD